MYEQTINKYYTDLEYHFTTKEDALPIINDLAKEIKNKDIQDLSKRFFETATIIETNLFFFVPICKHIDVVTAIIEYLNYYGAQFMFNEQYHKAKYEYKEHYIPISLLLTVFSMCREEAMILFLKRAIIEDSALIMNEILFYYIKIMINESNQINEMILLEDSDLYAVINCLMIMDNSCLNKIWIQESIRQKFLKLTKKYLNHFKCPVHVLQLQQELLLTFNTSHKSTMSTVSIWSENIVTAKNLASCLDGDIIFINTHMDFNGGVLLVPFARIIDTLIDRIIMNSINKTNLHMYDITPSSNAIKISTEHLTSKLVIYNLFYGGTWQKPAEGMYWKQNDKLFASATNDDIRRCVESAEEGFKIWHAYSIASRVKILSKLAKTLMYYRESLLSSLVSKCIQFASLYENSNGYCTHEEKLELIITRKPKGIIILKEENGNTLFFRLVQSLLAGNSVIVIFNANFCNLSQYFKMFSISDIPPGVINMLSSEDITDLESRLCGTQYSIYVKRFFSEGNLIEKYINSYIQLSLPKQVVYPLK